MEKQANKLFAALEWLILDTEVYRNISSIKKCDEMRMLFETEFTADCSFYLGREDKIKLETFPKAVEFHFGIEDDLRFFLELALFVNLFTKKVSAFSSLDGFHCECLEEELAAANRARLARGFKQLESLGFEVAPILSDQVNGISSQGFERHSSIKE